MQVAAHLDGRDARKVLAVGVLVGERVLDYHAEVVGKAGRRYREHGVVRVGCRGCRRGSGPFVAAVKIFAFGIVHIEALQGSTGVAHIQAHLAHAVLVRGMGIRDIQIDHHPVFRKVLGKAVHHDFEPVVALGVRGRGHEARVHQRRIRVGRGVREIVAVGLQVDTVVGIRVAVALDAAIAHAHGACAGTVVKAHHLAVVVAVGARKVPAHVVPVGAAVVVAMGRVQGARDCFRRKPGLRGSLEVETERRLSAGFHTAFGGIALEGRKAVVAKHDIFTFASLDMVAIQATEHHIAAISGIDGVTTCTTVFETARRNIAVLVGDHKRIAPGVHNDLAAITHYDVVPGTRGNGIGIGSTDNGVLAVARGNRVATALGIALALGNQAIRQHRVTPTVTNHNVVAAANTDCIASLAAHGDILVAADGHGIDIAHGIARGLHGMQAEVQRVAIDRTHIRGIVVFHGAVVAKGNVVVARNSNGVAIGTANHHAIGAANIYSIGTTLTIVHRMDFVGSATHTVRLQAVHGSVCSGIIAMILAYASRVV